MSIGFDPTVYTVPEGDTVNLVIRRTGNAEIYVVGRVDTSDVTATGRVSSTTLSILCYYFIFSTWLQLVLTISD